MKQAGKAQQNRLFYGEFFYNEIIAEIAVGYINNCLRKRLRKQLKIKGLR
ncbi:hypothetical protein [Mucilaginibacter sp. SG564]|nr:hypothetical protein [Mucilaginibacter sp. SG564]NOW96504.1 hypothetical protein [Mucilaginibacter sp. SG564]